MTGTLPAVRDEDVEAIMFRRHDDGAVTMLNTPRLSLITPELMDQADSSWLIRDKDLVILCGVPYRLGAWVEQERCYRLHRLDVVSP